MRISPEVLATMKAAIDPLITEDIKNAYREGNFYNSDKAKDVNARLRWDAYGAAGGYKLLDGASYNDSHIYTALKRIIPDL